MPGERAEERSELSCDYAENYELTVNETGKSLQAPSPGDFLLRSWRVLLELTRSDPKDGKGFAWICGLPLLHGANCKRDWRGA